MPLLFLKFIILLFFGYFTGHRPYVFEILAGEEWRGNSFFVKKNLALARNYSFLFFFKYISSAAPAIIDAKLISWATLNPINIRLSVLKPSMKNLPVEYSIRYKPKTWPCVIFLCFLNHIRKINIHKFVIDS